jgi:hypothetical protein
MLQEDLRQYIMGWSIRSKLRLDMAGDKEKMNSTASDSEITAIEICVQRAREALEFQIPQVKAREYDFAPPFRQMTVQLYLLGVMWRCGEGLDLATDARAHAFAAMESMLISDGMSIKKAKQRVAFLNQMSKTESGEDALAIAAGHQATPQDQSLVSVFDEYKDERRVSGSLWRLYEMGKKIMAIGGAVAAFIAIWAVTIFLPKTAGIDVLVVGLLAAAVVVIPTFLIGLLIYRVKIKK